MKKFAICALVFFLLCLTGESQQSPAQPPSKQSKPSPSVHTQQPVLTAEMRPSGLPAPSVAKPMLAAVLPVGTPIRVKLDQALDTHQTRSGDNFSAHVSQPLMLNGVVVVPLGASLQGFVLRASEPRRFKGRPIIQIKTQTLVMPDGQRYDLSASVVDTNRVGGSRVDNEGRIIGGTRTKRDNVELGAGSGVGGVIGAIAAGAKGGFIGAGAGAGVATAYWLTKRNSAYLPQDTEIILELGHPLVLGTQSTGQQATGPQSTTSQK